jgi:hypothetical protein
MSRLISKLRLTSRSAEELNTYPTDRDIEP